MSPVARVATFRPCVTCKWVTPLRYAPAPNKEFPSSLSTSACLRIMSNIVVRLTSCMPAGISMRAHRGRSESGNSAHLRHCRWSYDATTEAFFVLSQCVYRG